jgi:hypothetical protein
MFQPSIKIHSKCSVMKVPTVYGNTRDPSFLYILSFTYEILKIYITAVFVFLLFKLGKI